MRLRHRIEVSVSMERQSGKRRLLARRQLSSIEESSSKTDPTVQIRSQRPAQRAWLDVAAEPDRQDR